ncbi:glycosyltransferase family 39 protein [Chloroflexota bacterium]
MKHKILRWLLLVLLVGFGLRLVNLGGRTLWYDEAFAVLFARTGLTNMLYGTLTPVTGGAADIHPLLYYTILNGWLRIVGQTPAMVRLFSVFAGTLTIALVFRLATDLFDHQVGLVAAVITALAPFHIQYSQEARMYALLTLLLLLATWNYRRAWGQPTTRAGWAWWLVFAISAALAMYTQQLAAFYLAALGLTPVLFRRWDKLLPTFLAAGLAFVLYLPWFVNLPGQLDKLQAYYWIQRPTLARPLLTMRSFIVVALDIPPQWALPTFLVSLILVVFLLLQVAVRWRKMRRAEQRAIGWLLWLSFGSLTLMWLASQILLPVYLERALLAQGVILYCALAWLVVRGGLPRPILLILIAAWALVILVGYTYQVTWHTFPNSPFDQAARWLEDNTTPNDAIIHSNKLTALPLVYYSPELAQSYLADRPGSAEDTLALPTQEVLDLFGEPCIAAAANRANRVWFVIFEREIAQYLAAPNNEQPHLNWLRSHYAEKEPVRFADLLIIPFDNPEDYAPLCAGGS